MGPTIGRIILHTKDKSILANFLCELLDMSVDTEDNSDTVHLTGDGLPPFGLKDAEHEHLFARNSERDMFIDFTVDTIEELENMIHKMNFLSYRNGGEKVAPRVNSDASTGSRFIEVVDPDGRRWKFSYRKLVDPEQNQ